MWTINVNCPHNLAEPIWIMIKWTLVLLALGMAACSNSATIKEDVQPMKESASSFDAIAKEKLNGIYEAEYNVDSSYVLLRNAEPRSPFVTGVFMVYDLDQQKVLMEDRVAQANIKWVGNHVLEVTLIPGMVRGDGSDRTPKGYRYHVKEDRKVPLSSSKQP